MKHRTKTVHEHKMAKSNTITNTTRRAMLELANALAEFAARCRCIQTERRINKAVSFARKTYGYSDDQKQEEVLAKIRNGAGTVRDIEMETGMSAESVREALNNLERGRRLRRTRLSYGAGRGKPQFLYE